MMLEYKKMLKEPEKDVEKLHLELFRAKKEVRDPDMADLIDFTTEIGEKNRSTSGRERGIRKAI